MSEPANNKAEVTSADVDVYGLPEAAPDAKSKESAEVEVVEVPEYLQNLAPETQAEAKSLTVKITRAIYVGVMAIIAVGMWLIELKGLIGKGKFLQFLSQHFEQSHDTANRLMQVADCFYERLKEDARLELMAMYNTAKPKTPKAAVDEVIELANKGTFVSAKLAREIIKKYTEPEKPEDSDEAEVDVPERVVITWAKAVTARNGKSRIPVGKNVSALVWSQPLDLFRVIGVLNSCGFKFRLCGFWGDGPSSGFRLDGEYLLVFGRSDAPFPTLEDAPEQDVEYESSEAWTQGIVKRWYPNAEVVWAHPLKTRKETEAEDKERERQFELLLEEVPAPAKEEPVEIQEEEPLPDSDEMRSEEFFADFLGKDPSEVSGDSTSKD